MKPENEFLMVCDCGSLEHQVVFRWNVDDNEVYMHVHLFDYKRFFRRLWHGLKYAFGHRSKYGEFNEVILRKEDADNLQKVVDYLRSR